MTKTSKIEMIELMPKPKGFTLVELLVAITILAVLSIVAITIFSNVQKNARDTRRRGDIDAIAKALEVNKDPTASTYKNLTAAQFSSGAIPQDTTVSKYCVLTASAVGAPPAKPTIWDSSSTCPTSPTSYIQVSTTNPENASGSWTVCARLENDTGTPPVYCASSVQ